MTREAGITPQLSPARKGSEPGPENSGLCARLRPRCQAAGHPVAGCRFLRIHGRSVLEAPWSTASNTGFYWCYTLPAAGVCVCLCRGEFFS